MMRTLPDLLDKNMRVLSIGLNPSLPSVVAGFYFANPRNRFWKALNNCQIQEKPFTPSFNSCEDLLNTFNIGMTDLVKRPTAGCKDLKAADYRQGSERLLSIIPDSGPMTLWIHGKLTCQKLLQYFPQPSPATKDEIIWGKQSWTINESTVYISPNPSPANAAFSLDVISESYQALFALTHPKKPIKC
jgi:TDG/mug DNA glycosylase family protein